MRVLDLFSGIGGFAYAGHMLGGYAMTHKPQQLSPEEAKRRQLFYQKMAYIEMKKLRPKHPHV